MALYAALNRASSPERAEILSWENKDYRLRPGKRCLPDKRHFLENETLIYQGYLTKINARTSKNYVNFTDYFCNFIIGSVN
jgi:hypothetical protein